MSDELPVYSVMVSREDDLWVAVVEGLPGGATDVESFGDLYDAVQDLIATLTDAEIGTFWVEWRYRQGDYELTDLIQDLRQWEKQAEVAALNRDAARKAVVGIMRAAGLSYREIADVVNLSFQRVGQLVDDEGPRVGYRSGTATIDTLWNPDLVAKLRNVVIQGVHLDAGQEYLSPLEAALVALLDMARQVRPTVRHGLLSTTAEVLEEIATDEDFIRYG